MFVVVCIFLLYFVLYEVLMNKVGGDEMVSVYLKLGL